MLELKITIENDKVLIAGLQASSRSIQDAARRGITRVAAGVFAESHKLLSGPGRKQIKLYTTSKKTGERKRTRLRGLFDLLGARPGSYPPVPVITGNLSRLLNFVKPGETKTSNGRTFTAGPLSAIVFNSADYANVVHYGIKPWTKYGPRPFITDALQKYDQGNRIKAVLEEETQKAISASGL